MLRSVPGSILLVAVAVLLFGCSASRPRALPGDPDAGQAPVVEVGQRVTVETRDGRTLEGEVLELEADRLVLGWAGNYGAERAEVPFDEIARVTRNELTTLGKVGVVVISVAMTGLLVLLIGVSSIDADLS
ncbi:hypothetical protein GF314_06050 [bacterium]|nr:hypothetical protein [bacterium]